MDKSKTKSFFIKLIKNKFVITFLVFILWVLFFDQHSIWERREYENNIETLKKDKAYYLTKIQTDKKNIHELMTNKENLEKFAREKYLMKKPDEDIFIIIEE